MSRKGLIMSTILIVDGNSIINRAFYGQGRQGQLTSPDGTPTGAVYTFITMLMRYYEEYKPTHIAVAFDRKEPTFRHKLFKEYKAQREGMPEDLAVQMPMLKACLEALNIYQIERIGYEADDIIGSLVKQCSTECEVLILSGDRDDFQLLSENVKQIYPKKGGKTILYTPELLEEEFGIRPDQVVDFKALMGDTSDNIPGIKGIGDKTARKLLIEYGDLDTIYAHADKVKGAVGKNLREGKDLAYLSQDLARIDTNMDLEFTLDEMLVESPDQEKTFKLFSELGFKSLISRFGLENTLEEITTTQLPEWTLYRAEITQLKDISRQDFYLWFQLHENSQTFTLMLGYEGDKEWEFYIETNKTIENIREILQELHNKNNTIHCYDWKTLSKSISYYPLRHIVDLHIASYLVGFEVAGKTLAEVYTLVLRENVFHTEQIIEAFSGNLDASEVQGIHEIFMMLKLYEEVEARLIEKELKTLAEEIEYPLASVLGKMEARGVRVDMDILQGLGENFRAKAKRLQEEIFIEAGHDFNINSPMQLGEVLYEEMGIQTGKKTATGNYSTAASELERMAPFHPIIQKVLDYRTVSKLDSTFIQGLAKEIQTDGRIHTSFHQTLTTTGRLSSSEPNLQNIPIREDDGRQIRKAFVASPGYVLIDADYSQVELRLLAVLANEESLIDAFKHNADIHKRTASSIFGIPEEEVNPDQRAAAKTVNFSIIYGISDFGLSQDLNISRQEAKEYIEGYYAIYKSVGPYMESLKQFGREHGYVETYFGRRRYIPELTAKNYNVRSFGERAAMNAPIQGTAADIMKIAMINTEKALRDEDLDAHILLQVHDELLLEAKEDVREKVLAILKREMENAANLDIPLEVEVKTAKNWYESK